MPPSLGSFKCVPPNKLVRFYLRKADIKCVCISKSWNSEYRKAEKKRVSLQSISLPFPLLLHTGPKHQVSPPPLQAYSSKWDGHSLASPSLEAPSMRVKFINTYFQNPAALQGNPHPTKTVEINYSDAAFSQHTWGYSPISSVGENQSFSVEYHKTRHVLPEHCLNSVL